MTPGTLAATAQSNASLAARSLATAVPCYGDERVPMVRGDGCRLWDADGRSYLDMLSGLGAACLGQGHPAMREALVRQSKTLIHCSNLFVIEPQVELAEWLCEHSFAERVFFSNSGAEAVEAAVKLARRCAHDEGEILRREIVSFEGSFHGRTYGAMSVTGQAKVHTGFDPLVPGVRHAPFGDLEALDTLVGETTAAVIVEPIQGEGGVRPFSDAFLVELRRLCTERGALMVCDEVQSGMGRTGRLFAYEHANVTPDVVVVGKGLGGGVPIGAVLTTAKLAAHLGQGTHGTTYGGNPLVCATALAVVKTIADGDLIERAAALGEYFRTWLASSCQKYGCVIELRGRGLMIGVGVERGAAALAQTLFKQGIIVNAIGDETIRLLPPLIVTRGEIDECVDAIGRGLA